MWSNESSSWTFTQHTSWFWSSGSVTCSQVCTIPSRIRIPVPPPLLWVLFCVIQLYPSTWDGWLLSLVSERLLHVCATVIKLVVFPATPLILAYIIFMFFCVFFPLFLVLHFLFIFFKVTLFLVVACFLLFRVDFGL